MYVKLFGSILDSSVWCSSLSAKVVWITMLAMADEHGVVDASVPGLARRAGVSIDECKAALAEFAAPDEHSRTKDHDGRRIEEVDGGWLLLNHAKYREIQTRAQLSAAQRQQRHRDKRKGVSSHSDSVTSDEEDVTHHAGNATPASASSSVVAADREQQQKATAAPAVTGVPISGTPDPLDEVLAEAGLDLAIFGQYAGNVKGLLRSARSALAVAQTIMSHLPERGGSSTPAVVGLAVREFLAQSEPFNARFFDAFVKRAEKVPQQMAGRAALKQEAQHMNREEIDRENAAREDAEVRAMLADFERRHEARYAQLVEIAEKSVSPSFRGKFRAPVVQAALARLVRHDSAQGEEVDE